LEASPATSVFKRRNVSKPSQRHGTLLHIRVLKILGSVIPGKVSESSSKVVDHWERHGKLGGRSNQKALTSNELHQIQRRAGSAHQLSGCETSSSKGENTAGNAIGNGRNGSHRKGIDQHMRADGASKFLLSGRVVLKMPALVRPAKKAISNSTPPINSPSS
jgi:hypothetical protein